jgi:hypothetical protein
MKWFLGPMSKNIVDTIIEFSLKNPKLETYFIPSRRQVEYYGGYVNYWTLADFSKYVKTYNPNILIERDHGGPGQGSIDDDGYESLKEDCKYMNIIHIDPWKKYSKLEDGIQWTVDMLQYCDKLNSNLQYEIGTEEAIRPFSVEDLEYIIISLKDQLSLELFNKIKYLVIQCGTGLCEGNNIGTLNKDKLTNMIKLSKKYNLIAKEHNGDWVSATDVEEKSKLGLSHINIAPELAEIETKVILKNIKNNIEDYENVYQLCYNSGKWKKWVSASFIPEENKEALILFSCHYIYATPEFQKIIKKYDRIDIKIKSAIYNKLLELYDIYTIRTKCIICKSTKLDTMFENDYITTLSFNLYTQKVDNPYFIPYNILSCKNCLTVQTKYLGNLNIIYEKNHVDSYGIVKNEMVDLFTNFILKNNNINGIIEIGACNDTLANTILNNLSTKYTIIEADYKGDNKDITVINNFFEDININNLEGNTLILSHIFEHFYDPIEILEKISKSSNIKYIYFNHPNLQYYCNNSVYNILNFEHIYYIENEFLIKLLHNYNWDYFRKEEYNTHSIFIEFVKNDNLFLDNKIRISNLYSIENTIKYFSKMHRNIEILNNIFEKYTYNFYIWPSSAHNVALFVNGLNYNNLTGLLDNSPNKIGKYLYGYNLQCSSFNEIIQKDEVGTCIIISGAGNYCNEINIEAKNIKVININNLDDLKDL